MCVNECVCECMSVCVHVCVNVCVNVYVYLRGQLEVEGSVLLHVGSEDRTQVVTPGSQHPYLSC